MKNLAILIVVLLWSSSANAQVLLGLGDNDCTHFLRVYDPNDIPADMLDNIQFNHWILGFFSAATYENKKVDSFVDRIKGPEVIRMVMKECEKSPKVLVGDAAHNVLDYIKSQ